MDNIRESKLAYIVVTFVASNNGSRLPYTGDGKKGPDGMLILDIEPNCGDAARFGRKVHLPSLVASASESQLA